MVFSSLIFLFMFLPIVLMLYFGVNNRFKNFVLLISSLFFYAWGEPVYVFLMLFSTVVDYIHGLKVYKFINKGEDKKARNVVISSAIINLFVLCFFKYSDFLILNINNVFNLNIELLNLPLPIGISFYTFQTMSYTIDIYKKDAIPQKSVLDFGTYVALFPQLVAGPIVRYQTIATQMNERTHSVEKFAYGVERFIIGLSKKVLFSNSLGLISDNIFGSLISELSVLEAWIGITCYTLQIYFDFSGYSDMAIGLGKMFGFDFLENFNYPYISQSVSEFWRRWHISLGSWFRDYVYIPLGGNRVSPIKQYRNLFVVWSLTGIWHGADWTFITWGLYYGVLIGIEKAFLDKLLNKLPKILRHIYLIILVMIGWVFFRAENITLAFDYIKVMFNLAGNPLYNISALSYINESGFTILLAMILSTPVIPTINKILQSKYKNKINNDLTYATYSFGLMTLFLIVVVILINSTYNPFLYFRF